MQDTLAALALLERGYNGPIPEPLRRAARFESAEALRLIEARGEAAFFTAMVRGQIETIRRRRAEDSFYPALLADLALYRRRRRAWRAVARAWEGRLTRSGACSP